MIRIDFGSLFEFEHEDGEKKEDNRNKLRDFIELADKHEATVVEQRDWNARDLIHFVSISAHVTLTMSVSEKYLRVRPARYGRSSRHTGENLCQSLIGLPFRSSSHRRTNWGFRKSSPARTAAKKNAL